MVAKRQTSYVESLKKEFLISRGIPTDRYRGLYVASNTHSELMAMEFLKYVHICQGLDTCNVDRRDASLQELVG